MPPPSRRALLAALPALPLARSAAAQPGPAPEAVSGPGSGSGSGSGVESFDLGAGSGAPWRILVARPEGPVPAAGSPCLWLLDGNTTFPLAFRARAAAGAEGVALVGIGHPEPGPPDPARRFLEFTPPTAAETFGARRGDPPETGGRGAFLHFVESVLRPELARRLPLDPARAALFGHSLGGLFGLHVLLSRPELFEAYALADPSIWWNRRSVLDEQAAFLAGVRAAGGRVTRPIRVLITTSGRAGRAESVARMEAPAGRETAAALAAVPGLRVGFRHMAEETHGSMLPPAVADALALAAGRAPEAIAPG